MHTTMKTVDKPLICTILLFAFLAASASAFPLTLGQNHTEDVEGKLVTVKFLGLNTEEDAGVAFLNIDGKDYLIHNETVEKIGDLKVTISKVQIYDNLSGGIIYVSLMREASCEDNLRNQGETDIDCGGPCQRCATGKRCVYSYECQSLLCLENVCMASNTCDNEKTDGSETDVDCGGGCQKCAIGKRCNNGKDCASNICTYLRCAPEPQRLHGTCYDKIQNNGENGVDCGGECPTPCIVYRNFSTFCGSGCFFLNNECSCPANQRRNESMPNRTIIALNETAQQDQSAGYGSERNERIRSTIESAAATFNITLINATLDESGDNLIVTGTKHARLLGFIPISYTHQSRIELSTGKVIKVSAPRWAVLTR